MDVEKILQNLWDRASSTSFENEREIALQKIQLLKKKYLSMVAKKKEKEIDEDIPIKNLRRIFTETFFPYFIDGNIELNEDNVPVHVDYYFLESAKHRADENLREFPNNKKLFNFYKELVAWVKDVELYFKNRATHNEVQSIYNFIFLDLPTAYFLTFDTKGLQACYDSCMKNFQEQKTTFFEKLNDGWWDSFIVGYFDPRLLESS